MKEILVELLKVKSIITILLVATLVFLAVSQNIPINSEIFVATVSSVITYYFTRNNAKK